MTIQVLLADDHQILRQGLKLLLEHEGIKVVAEAGDGREAVEMAQKYRPDVAVLDVTMPVMNGFDAAREIERLSPKTKIVFLTMHTQDEYILQGVRTGAKGFVKKSYASDDLVAAIRDAARGRTYLSPEISEKVLQAFQGRVEFRPEPLSPRERQVLQLIAEGKTTKEVANILNISVKTAETHRTRMMEKLDIHETASLVRYAIRRGLVQP